MVGRVNLYLQHFEGKSIYSFPGGSVVKDLPASAGDTGSILIQEDHM